MSTINKEVLDNQNATADQDYLEFKQDMKDYVETVKGEYADLFYPAVLDEIAEHVLTKYKFPKFEDMTFLDSNLGYKVKHENLSLIEFLEWSGGKQDMDSLHDYTRDEDITALKHKVKNQQEYIVNLENTLSELCTSVRRLQEVAFPPTTPNKPTTKVGWLDRPVSQFNKRTGEFIRNWESPRHAERVLGKVNAHAIVEHLKRGSGSSGGYIWRIGEYTEEA